MNLRELTIVLLRLMSVWFAGSGLASIGHAIIQAISVAGIRIGADHDSFNWYAMIWLVSPLIEIAIGVVLWRVAPCVSSRIISAKNTDSDETGRVA